MPYESALTSIESGSQNSILSSNGPAWFLSRQILLNVPNNVDI